MGYASITDPQFFETIREWFQNQPEILVLIRVRRGGSRDFELFTSFETLADRIRELSPGTCVTAFRHLQLPMRGVVDDNFIAKCLRSIPDGSEYLMVETTPTVAGRRSWFHNGDGTTHASLREDLDWSRGNPVAVGLHPPMRSQTGEVIHAVVPEADGIVRAGPY